jgi:hypothetical protein
MLFPLSRFRERAGVRALLPLPSSGEGWGEGFDHY